MVTPELIHTVRQRAHANHIIGKVSIFQEIVPRHTVVFISPHAYFIRIDSVFY